METWREIVEDFKKEHPTEWQLYKRFEPYCVSRYTTFILQGIYCITGDGTMVVYAADSRRDRLGNLLLTGDMILCPEGACLVEGIIEKVDRGTVYYADPEGYNSTKCVKAHDCVKIVDVS